MNEKININYKPIIEKEQNDVPNINYSKIEEPASTNEYINIEYKNKKLVVRICDECDGPDFYLDIYMPDGTKSTISYNKMNDMEAEIDLLKQMVAELQEPETDNN